MWGLNRDACHVTFKFAHPYLGLRGFAETVFVTQHRSIFAFALLRDSSYFLNRFCYKTCCIKSRSVCVCTGTALVFSKEKDVFLSFSHLLFEIQIVVVYYKSRQVSLLLGACFSVFLRHLPARKCWIVPKSSAQPNPENPGPCRPLELTGYNNV